MYIKRLYYTEAKKELDEIIMEEDERLANLTDEERKKEESDTDFDLKEIYKRYKKKQPIKILNEKRIEYFFNDLVTDALDLAKLYFFDIEIKTTNECGIIYLSSEVIAFNTYSPSALDIYRKLLVTADDIYISSEDNSVYIRFTYDFFDRIPK